MTDIKPIPTTLHKHDHRTGKTSEHTIAEGYSVTRNGDVFSKRFGRCKKLKQGTLRNGYKQVNLGAGKSFYVHRLVATAFIENPNNLPCVDHIDGDPSNNDLSNLRWCTHKQNMGWADLKRKRVWVDDIEFPSLHSAAKWIADRHKKNAKTIRTSLGDRVMGTILGHEFRHFPYKLKIIKKDSPVDTRSRWNGELKPIEGFEGMYSITPCGKVISHKKSFDIELSPYVGQRGDARLKLKGKWLLVRRLVAEAYIDNPGDMPFVRNKDGNLKNNHIDNLEWCHQDDVLESRGVKQRSVLVDGRRFSSIYQAAKWLSDLHNRKIDTVRKDLKRRGSGNMFGHSFRVLQ